MADTLTALTIAELFKELTCAFHADLVEGRPGNAKVPVL
jgi:hypothetical protein